MSKTDSKTITVIIKDLRLESEQIITDLNRFLTEALPQIKITTKGNELLVNAPQKMSKKTLKLRLKKFLFKKNLSDDFRPISFKDANTDGFMIKKKKIVELSYY